MSSRTAQRSAALLALRWHAGSGALVALTAALTLAGAVPALSVLGGTNAAPSLTLALGDTAALLADWGGRGVVWPQLQQLAVIKLLSIVRAATVLTLIVGAATLLALHLARTTARSSEVIVARSIGASRRDLFGAMMLEAGALAGVALFAGMLMALIGVTVMRTAWPGAAADAALLLTAAGTLGITALVMVAPLLLVRALGTTRLVDDDRRPLTLIVPALQLGAALVVLAGGVTLRGVTAAQQRTVSEVQSNPMLVQDVRARETDRLARAKSLAAFLADQHAARPGALVSLASSGMHRGLGTIAQASSDCGRRCAPGTAIRGSTETVTHHAVSGDSFAVTGLRLLVGRAFTDADRWDAPLVAMVNASFARAMFGGSDPVGQRVQLSALGNAWFEVIGVVDDAAARGLGGVMQPPLGVYVSILQQPVALAEVATVHGTVAPDVLARIGSVRSAPRSLAAALSQDAQVLQWFTNLLLAMGAITALIAVGGLVAMLRLWLDSQQRELGIRRAVGARRRDVHLLVLGRAAAVAVGGSLFGAWLGQVFWDVLPRIVPGAPSFDGPVVLQTGAALSLLTIGVAFLMARRFTRTPIGTLLIEVG